MQLRGLSTYSVRPCLEHDYYYYYYYYYCNYCEEFEVVTCDSESNYVNFFSGYTESLDKKSEIVVPGDDHGLYAIDILDPSLVIKQ